MYLKRIGTVYYFYARVPIDLVPLLGKTEVKKSLKTSDYKTAKAAVKAYSLDLEKLGMIARTHMLDDIQLHKLLQRYKDSFLLGIDAARDAGASVMDVLEHQMFTKRPIAGLDVNKMLPQLLNLFGGNEPVSNLIKGLDAVLLSDKVLPEFKTRALEIKQALSEHNGHDAAITVYDTLRLNLKNELRTNEFGQETRIESLDFADDNNLNIDLPPREWINPNADEWYLRPQGDFLKVIRKLMQTKIDIFSHYCPVNYQIISTGCGRLVPYFA